MAGPCDTCPLEENLAYCCWRNPDTGESIEQEMDDGTIHLTCPELLPNGRCGIYDTRPEACREAYFCHKWEEYDLSDMIRLAQENCGLLDPFNDYE